MKTLEELLRHYPYYADHPELKPTLGVGEGWAGLVHRGLQACYDDDPNFTIHQIKEKFGGLRLYTSNPWEVTQPFEDESYSICEWCGEPGELDRSQFWLLTLCDKHKTERAAHAQRLREAYGPEWAAEVSDE